MPRRSQSYINVTLIVMKHEAQGGPKLVNEREGENRETSRMRLETCRIQTQKPSGGAELGVTVIICGG